ncbi:lysylphosphatidylglycerol synthase transmembrane domain-containing protein [Actinacidiphila sp. ITFR-21]|uniref:lysylphosphatidylglycerol synthase transmembrane domain-containing protein n=1 Tax=Actinacidiphila sp. ITFR-21 TaxID=3075199 RepID=UPI00288B4CAC|nr:lysylphosphatidylglycerol synthase transmembrane domain-containing protein [Streptomyces sp. ITFR-21]WNI19061.1 lysylphosphatidylglycerol synthase transmembrane domain-containing protein [Streptomyces sp. ITFR-21]
MTVTRTEDTLWQRVPGRSAWQRTAVRSAAVVVPIVLVGLFLFRQWPLIDSSAGRLSTADRDWLAAAAFAAFMTWVCSATALQGAVVEKLPPLLLLASQFAASAANHVLPAGVGGNAVSLRFLIRRGLTPTRSVTSLAVRSGAAVLARFVLLTTVLLMFPTALHFHRLAPGGLVMPGRPLLIAGVAAALVVFALLLPRCARLLRSRLRGFLMSVACDLRALHRDRVRVAGLWGGSVAFPMMHASVMIAVIRAVHAPVPVSGVLVAYLFASTAAGWLPTPAGLGSLDAALGLALVTAGASAVAATSAVLGYRLFTAWLPLIPGVLVLAALVKRREL